MEKNKGISIAEFLAAQHTRYKPQHSIESVAGNFEGQKAFLRKKRNTTVVPLTIAHMRGYADQVEFLLRYIERTREIFQMDIRGLLDNVGAAVEQACKGYGLGWGGDKTFWLTFQKGKFTIVPYSKLGLCPRIAEIKHEDLVDGLTNVGWDKVNMKARIWATNEKLLEKTGINEKEQTEFQDEQGS